MAIAPDRYGRLLNTLLNGAHIASTETLADLFAGERLSPWQFEVLEAGSTMVKPHISIYMHKEGIH